jgi:hypothetical protein
MLILSLMVSLRRIEFLWNWNDCRRAIPSMGVSDILADLPGTPGTHHGSNSSDETHLELLESDDIRSEVLLYVSKKGIISPPLLNHLPEK